MAAAPTQQAHNGGAKDLCSGGCDDPGMLAIADGPALGAYFAIPRVRGLAVGGDGVLLEVDLVRPGSGG